MRRIGFSWMNLIVPFSKDILDVWIGTEFSSFIKVNILVLASGAILQQELPEPLNMRCFASTSRAILHTGKVISN